jgi:rRNA-processing protein FCF1
MEAYRRRNNKVKCAAIDTNILMYIFLEKIDVFTQLRELGFNRFIIPSKVVEELENLKRSLRGREKLAARFALNLLSTCKDCEIVEVEAVGTDVALLKTAEKYGCVLITNDKNLKKRAKARSITVGYIREMRRIEIEDFV